MTHTFNSNNNYNNYNIYNNNNYNNNNNITITTTTTTVTFTHPLSSASSPHFLRTLFGSNFIYDVLYEHVMLFSVCLQSPQSFISLHLCVVVSRLAAALLAAALQLLLFIILLRLCLYRRLLLFISAGHMLSCCFLRSHS
eukprot:GHVS01004045.1.p1 GENE.GHVS01004045.1~~GHVS01004045.1.p1  ORF type:complete len:140 (-),score=33.63 GHVS01004045.1:158-577(-)